MRVPHARHRDLADRRRTVSACRASRSGRFRSTPTRGCSAAAARKSHSRRACSACSSCSCSVPATWSTRQELIDAVWKDAFVTDTSLAEAVSVLRQALADDPQSPTYIQTLHRRGYRFVAPVSTDGPATRADAPPNRPAGRRALRLAVDWRPTGSVERGGHLRAHRRRRGLASDARRPGGVGTCRAIHAGAGRPEPSFDESAPALAFSADGTTLAWSGCDASGCRLYVRALDRLEPSAIPGTDDGHAPFFSPDGRWIAFFADGRLKKVALAGGAPVTLADAPVDARRDVDRRGDHLRGIAVGRLDAALCRRRRAAAADHAP